VRPGVASTEAYGRFRRGHGLGRTRCGSRGRCGRTGGSGPARRGCGSRRTGGRDLDARKRAAAAEREREQARVRDARAEHDAEAWLEQEDLRAAHEHARGLGGRSLRGRDLGGFDVDTDREDLWADTRARANAGDLGGRGTEGLGGPGGRHAVHRTGFPNATTRGIRESTAHWRRSDRGRRRSRT
jgi:hypothetical protein